MKNDERHTSSLELNGRYYRWFPAEHHYGYTEESISLEVSRSALVVVDVYMLEKAALLARSEETKPLSDQDYQVKYEIANGHIAPVLEVARKIGLPVVYVNNSAPRIGLEDSEFGKILARAQGFSIEKEFVESSVDPLEYHYGKGELLGFIPALRPLPGDIYIRKHAYSGFFATRLESALRNLDVVNLIFVGFRLDCCLGTTMLDALYRNFKVILLRDCTVACELPDEIEELRFTKRMLIWFETLIGVSVQSTEFISACTALLSEHSAARPS
jgi:ureidoacrylate peracid hydrolase